MSTNLEIFIQDYGQEKRFIKNKALNCYFYNNGGAETVYLRFN